jgi:hypothetical protein
MKTPVRIRKLYGAGRLTAVFLAAALLPTMSQDQAPLPSVSGNLTLINMLTNQSLTLQVQAEIVRQGALLMPVGTVVADVPDVGPLAFEVTALEVARAEAGGVVVGLEADIAALNRETGLTLEVRLFDEDAEAANQLPGDYHQPFPAGDCVTWLKIGEREYQAACFHLLQTNLEVKAPPATPAG